MGEGNGNPLQYFCLENLMDRGAWWAAVFGVMQSRTRLKRRSSSNNSSWAIYVTFTVTSHSTVWGWVKTEKPKSQIIVFLKNKIYLFFLYRKIQRIIQEQFVVSTPRNVVVVENKFSDSTEKSNMKRKAFPGPSHSLQRQTSMVNGF